MIDLNRIPVDMDDATVLIRELRTEILRRPRAVILTPKLKRPDEWRDIDEGTISDIEISFQDLTYRFETVMLRVGYPSHVITPSGERPGNIVSVDSGLELRAKR